MTSSNDYVLMQFTDSLMLMEFPNLASSSVSLRGIFWLYVSKDGSGAPLADLHDLVVLFCLSALLDFIA